MLLPLLLPGFLGAALAFFSSPAQAQVWDLNEVSILMPLPRAGEEALMWAPRTAGRQGELLPVSVYAKIPNVVMRVQPQVVYEALRVVAVRIDPCFHEGFVQTCHRQVRLIWQPVIGSRLPRENAGTLTTEDASVHTFHNLSAADWREFRAGLERVRSQFPLGPGLPLQIHPHLRQQGYRGEFWKRWSEAVLPFVGHQNLVRVTVMTLNPLGNAWVFAGFEMQPGAGPIGKMRIPKIGNNAQAFFSGLDNTSEFRTRMNPEPTGQDAFTQFILDSAGTKQAGREDVIREALRTSLEIDNPALQNSGTVDCASCHASRAVGHWAQKHYPRWNWSQMFPREYFKAPGNATNTSVNPLRTDILRAFGYFGSDPIISQRTINESAISTGQMTRERFR